MDIFKLDGYYDFYGPLNSGGELSGEIKLLNNGIDIEGEINYHDSKTQSKSLKGCLFAEDGLAKLLFLESRNNSNFSDSLDLGYVGYWLSKPNKDYIEGKYSGNWLVLPCGESDDCYRLFSEMDLKVPKGADLAEISLSKS